MPGRGRADVLAVPGVERRETAVDFPVELREAGAIGDKPESRPPPADLLVDTGHPLGMPGLRPAACLAGGPDREFLPGLRELPVQPVQQLPPGTTAGGDALAMHPAPLNRW